MILLVNGEPLGGKGLTGPICPSSSLTFPLPVRPKPPPYVILLCLMSDDFTRQGRASGWERVKRYKLVWLVNNITKQEGSYSFDKNWIYNTV